MRRFYELGVKELNGHHLYALADGEYGIANAWLERQGLARRGLGRPSDTCEENGKDSIDDALDKVVSSAFVAAWEAEAN